MCGRFARFTSAPTLAELFAAELRDQAPPRYNVAPTQKVLALRLDPQGRRFLSALRWGLTPSWAKDPAIGNRMINARAETAHEKPAFRHAFRKRRCLIPADGFYEWRKTASGKQPYFIHRADRKPFCFAGLWEIWNAPEGEALESCTILTTDANQLLQPVHQRMPVILPPDLYDQWLDPAVADLARLRECLRPLSDAALALSPVSAYVNNVRNDDPRCIEALSG